MEQSAVEKVEALAAGLMDMLGRFSEMVRAVTGEVMGDAQGLVVEEIKKRIQVVQKEIYYETSHKYRDFLGATSDAERDLVAKMNRLRDLKERAGHLKELIASLVKPEMQAVNTSPSPTQESH
jgi:predicted  nucleic acid-binding Zn-ribbon protein